MTYKLITEDEVQQAITMLDTGIPVASRRVAATLRAVMEREGPTQVAWRSRHVSSNREYQYSSERRFLLGTMHGNEKGYPPQPLYTLPDEPTT